MGSSSSESKRLEILVEAQQHLRIEQMLALGGGDEQVIGRRLTPHQPLPSALVGPGELHQSHFLVQGQVFCGELGSAVAGHVSVD
ncbi:MAG TPA: hypothetical protein VKB87_13445 [Myxococcaceae bacterium]|nr:hypothetical protein [Myxococcaceae bacterium]